jgi:hypothetical protein
MTTFFPHIARIPPIIRIVAVASVAIGSLEQRVSVQPEPVAPQPEIHIPNLQERLTALVPDDPMPYFLLAEEVADEADTPSEQRLARQLYVVAYEIERERNQGRSLGASICLGLRQIERVEDTRAWLSALAGALDPRYASRDWSVSDDKDEDRAAALKTATMLGLARSGDGTRALTLRDDPEVAEMLKRFGSLLGPGGMTRLDAMMRAWPCPECHNTRAVSRPGRGGKTRLCNTCLGNPGDAISRAELLTHLRFESRLLNGVRRSWSAQAVMDEAAPLLDPEPDALAPQLSVRYRIDPSQRYWRDGVWVDAP